MLLLHAFDATALNKQLSFCPKYKLVLTESFSEKWLSKYIIISRFKNQLQMSSFCFNS